MGNLSVDTAELASAIRKAKIKLLWAAFLWGLGTCLHTWFPSLHHLWELDSFHRDAGSHGHHLEEVIHNQIYFQIGFSQSAPREFHYLLVSVFCLTPCSIPGSPVAGMLVCRCLWSQCLCAAELPSVRLTGAQPHAGLGSKQWWLGGLILGVLSPSSYFRVSDLCDAGNRGLCVITVSRTGCQNLL